MTSLNTLPLRIIELIIVRRSLKFTWPEYGRNKRKERKKNKIDGRLNAKISPFFWVVHTRKIKIEDNMFRNSQVYSTYNPTIHSEYYYPYVIEW